MVFWQFCAVAGAFVGGLLLLFSTALAPVALALGGLPYIIFRCLQVQAHHEQVMAELKQQTALLLSRAAPAVPPDA